jgi:hypothetical protein
MLALRIEQHNHWRQAPSVLDGRQPARDPDRESLASLGDGIRIYAQRLTRDGTSLRVCKRLVDGVWEPGTIEESQASMDANAGEAPAEVSDHLAPTQGFGGIARIAS